CGNKIAALCVMSLSSLASLLVFCFTDMVTPDRYSLSLHDALPIYAGTAAHRDRGDRHPAAAVPDRTGLRRHRWAERAAGRGGDRSEEHTSELQSRENLVCRLLLEKKKSNSSGTVTVY